MADSKKLKILFISHSYPPILGGVESQNYNLAENLKKIAEVKVIANGRGKKWLPVFIPLATIKAFFLMFHCDVFLAGNGILAPVGMFLKLFHPRKKFISVVHALDITYCEKEGILPTIYRWINIPSLKKLNRLIMVGNFTIDEAEKVGIERKKCVFIPNGVSASDLKEAHTREELSKLFGDETKDKKVLLRLGRFVPHKGTAWFIENVMPCLSEDVVLVATGYRVGKKTAGDPDNFEDCEKAIEKNKLQKRVKLLPTLPQEDLKVLLNKADIVVAPNIKVHGSSEGFGINVIEAGVCERVVIASKLEGLADAIKDGQNGFLVETGNVDQWKGKIEEVIAKGPQFIQDFGKKAGRFVEDNYSWEGISKRYLEEIEKVINE